VAKMDRAIGVGKCAGYQYLALISHVATGLIRGLKKGGDCSTRLTC
jgi:hypothetical protein